MCARVTQMGHISELRGLPSCGSFQSQNLDRSGIWGMSDKGGKGVLKVTSPHAIRPGIFGCSIAAVADSSNRYIVGAEGESVGNLLQAGRAYFVADGDAIHQFTSFRPQDGGSFGRSVAGSALQTGLTVVGASLEGVGPQPGNPVASYKFLAAGHAYVFDGIGTQLSTLTSPQPAAGAWFGTAVAIGNVGTHSKPEFWVAVGEPRGSLTPLAPGGWQWGPGTVHVFNLSNPTNPVLAYSLQCPGGQDFSGGSDNAGMFGWSIAVDGNLLVVGAPDVYLPGALCPAGAVYVYDLKTGQAPAGWGGQLPNPNPYQYYDTFGYGFGACVAACMPLIAVGDALATVNNMYEAGRVFIINANNGAVVQVLTSPTIGPKSYFGCSVSMIGTPSNTVCAVAEDGKVHTFNPHSGTLLTTFAAPNTPFGGPTTTTCAAGPKSGQVGVGASFETANGHLFAGQGYFY